MAEPCLAMPRQKGGGSGDDDDSQGPCVWRALDALASAPAAANESTTAASAAANDNEPAFAIPSIGMHVRNSGTGREGVIAYKSIIYLEETQR